jgi:hypothetical protein
MSHHPEATMVKHAAKTRSAKTPVKTRAATVPAKTRGGAKTADPRSLPPDAVVPIPPRDSFNNNLTSTSEATMLKLFGTPGERTADCSPATGAFARRVVSNADVGPFRVSGLDVAVRSLKEVFAEAQTQIPQVVASVKSDGMLCVRHKRGNRNSFSNHSWGAAIDLFFGKAAVPQGVQKTDRGCLQLAPFFNKHGWYWGAGFSGKSVDSMHFELAEETIVASAKASPQRVAAAPLVPHAPVHARTFAGLDLGHFPGTPAMAKYRSAGFEITAVYLSHSQHGKDSSWIDACPTLARDGWGLVPIFFGAQLVDAQGHHQSPPADPLTAAATDATLAVKLAEAAKLEKGQTVFLDVETSFPRGGGYESYVLKWAESVKGAGYKVGIYCQRFTLPWALANKLPAWTVHLNHDSGFKDPRTNAVHWCHLEVPLPDDAIDDGAMGTQTRFFCRAGGLDNEIDYDRFMVPDPSRM